MGKIRKVGKVEQVCLQALHQMIREHCKETSDTQAVIAEEIGDSPATLSQKLNCNDGHVADDLKFRDVLKIRAVIGRYEFDQVFATTNHGIFTVMPKGDPNYEALGKLFKEIGEVGMEFTTAYADGAITEKEKAAILKQIREAKQALVDLEVAIDQMSGNVQPMKGAM